MLKLSFAALAACTLLASAAVAQPVNTITDSDAPPAATTTSKTKDGKICKSLVITGSRVPTQRICKTKEEWDTYSVGAREGLDALQRNGLTRNCVAQGNGSCGQ